MIKVRQEFVALAIFAVMTAAPSVSAQPVTITDDWVTLRPPGQSYRILMPPDWRQDVPRTPHMNVSFIARQPAPTGRPGVTNCNVTVEQNPDSVGYTQDALDAIVTSGPVPQELIDSIASGLRGSAREASVARVSNHPAYFMVLDFTYQSLDVTVHVVTAMAMLSRPGWTYTVGCSASDRTVESAEAAWIAWRSTLLRIIGTFDFED
jgi:hypothetical protein